ncbi:MAG: permease-like cell division protein FtsX [bacterium]
MNKRFTVWLSRHLQVLFDTLGRLWKTPVSSTMTILVLAIAMTLPMVLYKIFDTLEAMTSDWAGSPRISVFLDTNAEQNNLDPVEFGQQLLQNPIIEDVEYISPQQGLKEFANLDGFGEAIDALPNNPLPPLLIVLPVSGTDNTAIRDLAAELENMLQVDTAVYDQQWVNRLTAIVDLFQRGVIVLACLMGVGIVLVISNTVRLGIINRAAEIEIIDQVGGTHAFIRRPFLYAGAVHCFLGSLLAWGLTNVSLYMLARPVSRLAVLYESDFRIGWAGPSIALFVAAVAVLLGLTASRFTVDRHLGSLTPG